MTWIIIISILATALAGGGGVAYAATESLPGDALYPLKTTLQDLELAFASNEADVGILLDQMEGTLEELEILAQKGRFDDMEEGIDEYVEDFIQFSQVRTRTSYDDAHPEDSINLRLQTQYQALTNLQAKFQHSDKMQQKLQTATQLTETGMTYGPNPDGGKPEVTGEPNGVGPAGTTGEAGNKPEDAGANKPEDAGTGSGEGQGNSGSGQGNGNSGDNGQQLNEKGCRVSETGEELCKPEDIGYICTETAEGELVCVNEHPEYGYGAYICEKMGEEGIICKPEDPRSGPWGQQGPGNGPGGAPAPKP